MLVLFLVFGLVSCGRSKTEKLLLNKKWMVTDVTQPAGNFNVEEANQARELKEGFYKNGWFKFLPDSVFIASLGGHTDTGKYHINLGGDAISLYPKSGGAMYEQIRVQRLSENKLVFNTIIADFHLVLHLSTQQESGK